jgi:hypothetical protein
VRDPTNGTAIGISCASRAARILCLRRTQPGHAEHRIRVADDPRALVAGAAVQKIDEGLVP